MIGSSPGQPAARLRRGAVIGDASAPYNAGNLGRNRRADQRPKTWLSAAFRRGPDSTPAVTDKRKWRLVVQAGRVLDALRLFPYVAVDRRKDRLAPRPQMHQGEGDLFGQRQDLRIDLGPSDHRDLAPAAPQGAPVADGEGIFEPRRDNHARREKIWLARDHDVGAPGERLPKRQKGLAPHDDRPAPGEGGEMVNVGFESPRQAPVPPDHAVLADRRDDHDGGRRRFDVLIAARSADHTATSALMCGCGSYPSRRKSS